MKKLIAISLFVIYAMSVSGMAINFHYCHGKLSKVSLVSFGQVKGCGCNPKDMPKDCCKDKQFSQKTEKHNTAQSVSLNDFISFITVLPPSENLDIPLISGGYNSTYTHICKRSCPQPIFLLNRNFRI
ncbi:MAG: hypothetical protein J0I09_02775 [Sphingobacteriia bacterium]|nr:hypothetical protein [Sphingobacteriia bacterium]